MGGESRGGGEMPVTYYTEDDLSEHKEQMQQLKENLFTLSRRLASTAPWEGSSRPYVGQGCIKDGRTEYCYGCPASDLCPYEYKGWPK